MRTRGQARPEARRRGHERVLEAALRHRLDVGAGGEPLVAARDHDAADLGVVVPALEQRAELLHQLWREGVAGVGAVQLREPDRAVGLGGDEAHGTSALMPV